ncbi:MAG: GNAT family N-acetyltransferase [Anaerolineae bacterium]|nr:GNAT family N-acetyltransferase [Anaerolineae bacterium]
MPDAIAITIRPAKITDDKIIKSMIRGARLDPTSLNWRNFLIAEHQGKIVGIGQVKHYPGCNELGSLVTFPKYRGKGVAARLISELEAQAGFPLYLLCASKMEAYYQRFGYETISWWEAPTFLKLKLSPTILVRIFGIRVLIMRKLS